MTTKELLHRLIDDLPEQSLPAAERVLAGLRDGDMDPLKLRLLTAEFDNEAETDEERQAAQEGRDQAKRGDLLSDAAVWQQLGHVDQT